MCNCTPSVILSQLWYIKLWHLKFPLISSIFLTFPLISLLTSYSPSPFSCAHLLSSPLLFFSWAHSWFPRRIQVLHFCTPLLFVPSLCELCDMDLAAKEGLIVKRVNIPHIWEKGACLFSCKCTCVCWFLCVCMCTCVPLHTVLLMERVVQSPVLNSDCSHSKLNGLLLLTGF